MNEASEHGMFQGTSVLITGGCGFIGSHLVERLVNEGANVTVLDNLRAGTWRNLRAVEEGVRRVEGDVRNSTLVERLVCERRPKFVFHLAANASVPGSVEDPVYDFESNCVGTFVVLNALRTFGGCQKVVIASSGAVYGEPTSYPILETDSVNPISPYGASKLASEVQGRMLHGVYQVPIVIARLFNCYGPRMARFVVLDFLRKLHNDSYRLEVLGSGQQVRDFTYVSDTVEGLLLLAISGQGGEAYNVSSGSSCSVTELARTLIQVLGLQDRTQIVYTGKSWIGDAQRWEVSIEKLRVLGYDPRVGLAEGLTSVARWFFDSHGEPWQAEI